MNISYQTLIVKKNEIFEELKDAKYNGLEDLVYRMQLTYDEVLDKLDLKNIPTERKGNSLKPDVYQISDINKTLNFLLPENVKICVTIDHNKKCPF